MEPETRDYIPSQSDPGKALFAYPAPEEIRKGNPGIFSIFGRKKGLPILNPNENTSYCRLAYRQKTT